MAFVAGLLVGFLTGASSWLAVAAWLGSQRGRFGKKNFLEGGFYDSLPSSDCLDETPYGLSQRIAHVVHN